MLLNGTILHFLEPRNNTFRFQGITCTVNIPLNKSLTSRDIRNIFQDRYAGEKLIHVTGDIPLVKDISGKHHVSVGGFAVDEQGKRVVICVTIDNLLKGGLFPRIHA